MTYQILTDMSVRIYLREYFNILHITIPSPCERRRSGLKLNTPSPQSSPAAGRGGVYVKISL
jgi:hypothetical protein